MRRWCLVASVLFALPIIFAACGSRAGFEDDFAERPPPDAPEAEMTDEEIEQGRKQNLDEQRQHMEELREEQRKLYMSPGTEIDDDAAPEPYRLGPGDRFDIRFVQQFEMDNTYIVQPDGRVSFDLIGENSCI